MEFEKAVMDIIEAATAKYASEIEQAVEVAEKEIRQLHNFQAIVNAMITKSVRELVYDARHKSNVATKRQAGYYGGPAKVDNAGKPVQELYKSCYEYFIAGMALGMLMGKQLSDIALRERMIAGGHIFNARLCEKLRPLVKDEQMVRDAVPEKRLRLIFKRLQEGEKQVA